MQVSVVCQPPSPQPPGSTFGSRKTPVEYPTAIQPPARPPSGNRRMMSNHNIMSQK